MAKVFLSEEAAEQAAVLPVVVRKRIDAVVVRLEAWPGVSGAKPLRGNLAGQFRVRTGDYRVQFTVGGRGRDAVVTVVKIGHRDGFYDE